ncbi:MAG: 2,3-bisphosphoglycerate-independent phosphoglycerate mutase [Candidatus Bipolaricaulia bacterium]
MKAVLVIADGLGGRPTDYDGKTCLEAARAPHLDALAERGINGLLYSIKPGVRPGSDTAHLSIFGYDPEVVYTGRGVFEAVGIGMEVGPGDVCLRTNFATVDDDLVVVDRRAGRISEGQNELERAVHGLKLNAYPDVDIHFKVSTEHRGALVLRGENLSSEISDPDPHKTGVKIHRAMPLVETEAAWQTAEIVNALVVRSYELLADLPFNRERERRGDLPANLLLPRGAAVPPQLTSLQERYGIEGAVIATGALYIGVAKLAGLRSFRAEGATGGLDSKILNKAILAVETLKDLDFVFIHVKGTDAAGHDHDAEAKIAFIERIDEMFAYLLQHLDWDETHLAFTGDHATPILYGDHTAEPVPIVFAGPNVLVDGVNRFNERSTTAGGLGVLHGQVLPVLFSYNDWGEKYGA